MCVWEVCISPDHAGLYRLVKAELLLMSQHKLHLGCFLLSYVKQLLHNLLPGGPVHGCTELVEQPFPLVLGKLQVVQT